MDEVYLVFVEGVDLGTHFLAAACDVHCTDVQPRFDTPARYRQLHNVRPYFPIFEVDISRCLPPSQRVQRGSWRSQDWRQEMASDECRRRSGGCDTTQQATQAGVGHVEACLGGPDDCAFGVDEGVKSASLLLPKRCEWHCLIVRPSVNLMGLTKNSHSEQNSVNPPLS